MPKVSIKQRRELDFDSIRVVAQTQHADEDFPKGIPFLEGDTLDFVIDLKDDGSAFIRDWPGEKGGVYTKVCDCCSVYLMHSDRTVASREENYVPSFMPGQHFGDYLDLDVSADGRITNWRKNPDYSAAFADPDDA